MTDLVEKLRLLAKRFPNKYLVEAADEIERLLEQVTELKAEIERLRKERDTALRLHAARAKRMTGLSERMYNKGLEEAAQVAENYIPAGHRIAAAIRELKEKPND